MNYFKVMNIRGQCLSSKKTFMHDIPGHASESNKNLFTFSTKSTTNQ
jgi:hypothetical protein